MEDFDINMLGDTELDFKLLLEPISSNPLPQDITKGSTITIENTLRGDVDKFDALILFELKKQYPNATYEDVIKMSKDPSLSQKAREKIKEDSQMSLIVTDKIDVKHLHNPNLNFKSEDINDFFEQKVRHFNDRKNIQYEINPEEYGNIDTVYIGGGVDTPAFKNLLNHGIYGDINNNPTYFTTDYAIACSHINDEQPALIEIDLKKILELRKTYRDPESLYIESESGKTFILFNGIPADTIKRILIMSHL